MYARIIQRIQLRKSIFLLLVQIKKSTKITYGKFGLSILLATTRLIHLLLHYYIIKRFNAKTCQYGKEEHVNILAFTLWMKPQEIILNFPLLKFSPAIFNLFDNVCFNTNYQHALPQLVPTSACFPQLNSIRHFF